jgi:hypothetical protein
VFAPAASAVHHDSVALDWHRNKMMETARDGVPVLLSHYPDFLQGTAFEALLPMDRRTDGPAALVRKGLLRAALNPATLWALEQWARRTDAVPGLYFHPVYRALNAAWFLRGRRLRQGGRPLVVYGG